VNPTTLELPRSMKQALRSLGRTVDLDVRARRSSVRRPVNVRVHLLPQDSRQEVSPREAWALNLSAGGMRLVSDAELQVGEILYLRIEHEVGGSAGLAGHGRVVWVKVRPDGFVSGIEFVDPH
jgi:PilZ domain-containing protein